MGKPKYILDTNILIGMVKGLFGTAQSIALPLDGKMYISVITRMEVLAYPFMTAEEAGKIHTLLRYFTIVPLNRKVEKNAILFRAKTKNKLPDSIVAAAAITLNAILLSNDSDLLNVKWPGLMVQKVLSV